MLIRLIGSALLALALAAPASANEAAIKKSIESRLNGAKVSSVSKTPIAGLWEVVIDGPGGFQILYSDAKGDHAIFGDRSGEPQLVDLANRRNLTEERLNKLNAVNFKDLPFDQSFKIVRGNGKRQLAYFSDPNCPYCKRLDADLAKLDDVTIHVFLYPILSPDSTDKAKAVWCSKDRAKTWVDMMVNGVAPAGDGKCETPIEKNLAFGQKMRITGTPTLFFANGQRVPGAVPLERLNQLLADAGK